MYFSSHSREPKWGNYLDNYKIHALGEDRTHDLQMSQLPDYETDALPTALPRLIKYLIKFLSQTMFIENKVCIYLINLTVNMMVSFSFIPSV